MKILLTDRLSANHYIMVCLANAFVDLGHEVFLWDVENQPTFDVFNKYEPDILLHSSWQLDRASIKNIAKRPNLKTLLSLSNFGDDDAFLDPKFTHLASDQEKRNVEELTKVSENVIGTCQYHQKYVNSTHNKWGNAGIKETLGLLLSADIKNFPLTPPSPAYKSELFIVSGYWPHKGENLSKYITSLCYPNTNLDIKIFGNGWGIPQAFGFIPDELIKHYYASALVSPNIHEPQAIQSGIDVNQRSFQSISAGGFQISQRVRSMEEDIFTNNEVVFVDSPKEFFDHIVYFREHTEERLPYIKRGLKTVYSKHTNTHRVKTIFEKFGYDEEVKKADILIEKNYKEMEKRFIEIYGERL